MLLSFLSVGSGLAFFLRDEKDESCSFPTGQIFASRSREGVCRWRGTLFDGVRECVCYVAPFFLVPGSLFFITLHFSSSVRELVVVGLGLLAIPVSIEEILRDVWERFECVV